MTLEREAMKERTLRQYSIGDRLIRAVIRPSKQGGWVVDNHFLEKSLRPPAPSTKTGKRPD